MQSESKKEAPKRETIFNFGFFYNAPAIDEKRVYSLINKGEYKKLVEDWGYINKKEGKKQIKAFLKKEGYDLLHRAVVINSEPYALECLYLIVETNILQENLAEKNYDILQRFLRCQSILEKMDRLDATKEQYLFDKFIILFHIDPAVITFMGTNKSAYYMTPAIIRSFKTAKESFEAALKANTDINAPPPAPSPAR